MIKSKSDLRDYYNRFRIFGTVNWIKTVYFNFKMFPYKIAKKLPVYFYGQVSFQDLSGKIEIFGEIKPGMIGFGQPFELLSKSKGTAEIYVKGTMRFSGHVQFGKDYFIYVGQHAVCEMGHMSSLGNSGKIICTDHVKFGTYARLGFESQVMDSNFHTMINTDTGEKYEIAAPISIGDYNYVGHRVTIMQNTKTPNFCTIASNTVCNKDYFALGENCLIGGIPAKHLKSNISRDWEGEKDEMQKWLIV